MQQFDYEKIEKLLGVSFASKDLLLQAFTHSSYSNTTGAKSNQRIEYLGDSVVNLIVAEYLYSNLQVQEGELSVQRAKLVRENTLAIPIRRLHLHNYLLLPYGEAKQNLQNVVSVQADLFEAIVGAIYLDKGYDSARQFTITHLLENPESSRALKLSDNYKGELQEFLQGMHIKAPTYKILSSKEVKETNSHIFSVGVYVDNKLIAKADGNKRATAEQESARLALQILKNKRNDLKGRKPEYLRP